MIDYEAEFTKGLRFNKKKALEAGLVIEEDHYTKKTPILDGQFSLLITIDKNGILGTKLLEIETGEVFVNHKIESAHGEFVGKIREEFTNVIKSLVLKVYESSAFASDQAERIVKQIKERYDDGPEYLWEDDQDDRVFRNKDNKKWYGIIMRLPGEKFDRVGQVEVMNIKLAPEEVAALSTQRGFSLAYHMNKTHWLSIFLDEEVDDDIILNLIEKSHNFTVKKGRKAK